MYPRCQDHSWLLVPGTGEWHFHVKKTNRQATYKRPQGFGRKARKLGKLGKAWGSGGVDHVQPPTKEVTQSRCKLARLIRFVYRTRSPSPSASGPRLDIAKYRDETLRRSFHAGCCFDRLFGIPTCRLWYGEHQSRTSMCFFFSLSVSLANVACGDGPVCMSCLHRIGQANANKLSQEPEQYPSGNIDICEGMAA